MVFYRKYRPQSLEELIGQTAVKQNLKSAVLADKLSHAYLFCGPKGTGKTSTARILAKIVNCESSALPLPCNSCHSCLSITEGSSLDVIEMDAASNRGIEDIRSLRENIKLAPLRSRKKVYIIDEVHQLSGDAFNALLKTLEEPPSHVLFILATTEVQKIPQTILSRVTRLDFQPASPEEIKEALKIIVEKEKIKIEEEALVALAKKAGGSFRDGEKLLDQLSSLGKIDQRMIEENIGRTYFEVSVNLLSALAETDQSKALKLLLDEEQNGANLKELNLSLLDVLRRMILMKNGLEKDRFLDQLAEKFTLNKILEVACLFQESLEQAKFSLIPNLPLEVAVIKACLVDQSVVACPDAQLPLADNSPVPLQSVPLVSEEPVKTSLTKDTSSDIQKITERWNYLLETVRQYNYSLEALLRSSKLASCDEKNVFLEVPYSFHQRIIEAPKSKDLLESILADILERPVKIGVVLGKKPLVKEELANVEIAPEDDLIKLAAEIFSLEAN